jgi:hypothetical protein
MELERIGVVLRPRAPREAVDLGVVMLREHAVAVWSAWFAFTLPIAVVCIALGALIGLPWLGLLLLWWMLPLFDRLPVFVLSRAVFDRAPSWRETLRGQRKMPWGGTWASLTWRRLDTQRALRLPLELLEGLTGKQRGPRWRVLRRNISGSAVMLTYGCLQLELVLFFSVFLLIALFVPRELVSNPFGGLFGHNTQDSSGGLSIFVSIVGYFAMSVIEPWYIAAGFGLYLTRRTQLEAWDVDLAFRRMRHRLMNAGRALALVLACVVFPQLSHAADKKEAPPPQSVRIDKVFDPLKSDSDREFGEAVARAYEDKRFGRPIKKLEWVPRQTFDQPKREKVDISPPNTGNLFAGGINILLWSLLAVAVVMLAIFAARHLRLRNPAVGKPGEKLHTSVTELPVAAPLPDDLAGATRMLWRSGKRREALALLYRGCVEQVAAASHSGVPDDATEAECLRRARALDNEEQRQRAVAIVRAWQYAAYADRFPSDHEVDALLIGWPAQAGRAA